MRSPVLSPSRLLPLVLLAAAPVLLQTAAAGELAVESPWARATPPAAPVAAGYATLVNRGSAPDRLVAVTSPAADRVEVHESTMVDGIARMRPVDGLVVAPGATVVLEPGGRHLMFQSLTGPLRRGERFRATLVFERAGAVSVEFEVQAIGASRPAHAGHGTPTR